MKNICIIGDSWACGEWGWNEITGEFQLCHNTLELLFDQNHKVKNFGEVGASNSAIIKQLKKALTTDNFDYIFCFQTDPLRCLRPYDWFVDVKLTFEDLVKENYNQTKNFYKALNNLNVQVYCIGGCGKINVELMSQYPNLLPYIPAVTEWLEPTYTHPELWASDWQHAVNNQFDLDSLDKLLECKKMQDQLETYRKYFWPDGRHLNRLGNNMLFDKICKDFNL
jgi:hypothetical protein